MPVMKNSSSTTTRRGYVFVSDATKVSTTFYGTPGNYMYSGLSSVGTTSGKKPKTLTMNNQLFKKLSWMDTDRIEVNIGVYLGKPYLQATHNFAHSYIADLFGGFYTDGRLGVADWASLDARSLEKMLESMRGSHASLAVDFAERHQTIDMLRKSLKLKKLVSEFAKEMISSRTYKRMTRQGRLDRRSAYVSGKWLEYRYGWLPLVNSIYDVADALHTRRVATPIFIKSRSGRNYVMRQTLGKRNAPSSNPLRWGENTCSYRVERGAYYNSPGDSVSDWTTLNPALIAWELVPFSFIADWFVGVGQCLENWENYWIFRNRYITGYITHTTKEDRSATQYGHRKTFQTYWPNGTVVDGTYEWQDWTSATCVWKYKERWMVPSLPAPGWPRVKLGLNSNRMLDVAALISTSVKAVK